MNNTNNNNPVTDRDFKKPVSWLLGRELLAGLKYIAAYSFMGDKLDAKDWMQNKAENVPNIDNIKPGESYWFDFIADTGDGMLPVYNIAYLCMSDLWLDNNAKPDQAILLEANSTSEKLPRGEFLFIGGDTAYHIADIASLKERFQTPFNWAYEDLTELGKQIDKRPIYGIPANHDYYDALDGFNRQFRRPFNTSANSGEQLELKGFERVQEASYVALNLPFGWQIWGFDSQEGKMDMRQWAFFASTFYPDLLKKPDFFSQESRDELKTRIPDKLIIVTPEPTTVFGKWQAPDAAVVKTFSDLGLPVSFLQEHKGALDPKKCRLDISGDIHHYERYWGDAERPNYASVVAGGGGAFLHPSHTDLDEVEQQQLYPTRLDSHRLSIKSLLCPLAIFNGGFIWLAGALVGLLSYFAVTVPQSTWSLIGRYFFPNDKRPLATAGQDLFENILARTQTALNTDTLTTAKACCSSVYLFDLAYILVFIGFLGVWIYYLRSLGKPAPQEPNKVLIIINALRAIITPGLYALEKLFDEFRQFVSPIYTRLARLFNIASKPFVTDTERLDWRVQRLFIVLPVVVLSLPLLHWISLQRDEVPHAFLASVLIELNAVAAVLLFVLNRMYSDLLNQRALKKPFHKFDLYPLWVFGGILAPLFAGYGFLHYGIYPAAIMTFNLLIVLIWTLCIAGLPLLAYFAGAALLRSKKEAESYQVPYQNKCIFFGIGAWHAILQVATPVCLVLYSSWQHIFAISALAIAVTEAARRYFATNRVASEPALPNQSTIGKQIFLAWGVTGATVLIAACWGEAIAVTTPRLVAAFVLGTLFSCIWFGWYLAVSLAFNGHNNEAGGGARSENYRHMLRIALRQNSLTAYVIGIDRPYTDAEFKTGKPTFRLVDKFTIEMPSKSAG